MSAENGSMQRKKHLYTFEIDTAPAAIMQDFDRSDRMRDDDRLM